MIKFTNTAAATDGPKQHDDSYGWFNVPFPINQLTVILGTALTPSLAAYNQYIVPANNQIDDIRDKIEDYLFSLGMTSWSGDFAMSKLTKTATAADGPRRHDSSVGWFKVQLPVGLLSSIDGTANGPNEAGYNQYALPGNTNWSDIANQIEAYLLSLGLQPWKPPPQG